MSLLLLQLQQDCLAAGTASQTSLHLLLPLHAAVPCTGILEGAKAKPRKFTETIELQIGLKNYDPQKDKRFSGTVKLPYIPRPGMKVCSSSCHSKQTRSSRWAIGSADSSTYSS
jgi:hypothetical protein